MNTLKALQAKAKLTKEIIKAIQTGLTLEQVKQLLKLRK